MQTRTEKKKKNEGKRGSLGPRNREKRSACAEKLARGKVLQSGQQTKKYPIKTPEPISGVHQEKPSVFSVPVQKIGRNRQIVMGFDRFVDQQLSCTGAVV